MNHSELLRGVFAHFAIAGELTEVTELKIGHLHTTLLSHWENAGETASYVHQRINTGVFSDVDALMKNLEMVLAQVALKLGRGLGDPDEVPLTLIPTRNRKPYLKTPEGDFWRTYRYVDNSETHNTCHDAGMAYDAAKAFGRFQSYLVDLPRPLTDPIPNFMDCERRFLACAEAAAADPLRRAGEARKEIDFVYANRAFFSLIQEGERRGELPKRATHGDMKLNNLLFSKATSKPLCVVDLDTCMMGSYLFDFGDLVRVSGVTAKEDERDLSLVDVHLEFFEGLAQGYGESVRSILLPKEKEIASLAPQLLALTVGTRFLTDYLLGDTYFRIDHPLHNLERARCQFQIVTSMEARKSEMAKITKRALGA